MKLITMLEATSRQQKGHHLHWQTCKRTIWESSPKTLKLIVQDQIGVARQSQEKEMKHE
jgi:hypothetical protein